VCNYGIEGRSYCRFLATGHIEVFDSELWVIGIALDGAIQKIEPLQMHGAKTVAIFSN
jgi:hypothetical protein